MFPLVKQLKSLFLYLGSHSSLTPRSLNIKIYIQHEYKKREKKVQLNSPHGASHAFSSYTI